MATAEQVKRFIEEIAPAVQKYAKIYGYKVVSPIIAQACCESAYGTSSLARAPYYNFFGMKCGSSWKGRSVNMATKEEFTVGTLTSVRDNFRAYDSLDLGVGGYFEFIGYSRYANLKTATTPRQYLELIKADGYCTSSTYVNTCMKIIEQYNLTQYDGKAVYYPKYEGNSTSIINILNTLRFDSGFTYRQKIAQANDISNYTGTALQNLKLVDLFKKGICKMP